MDAAKSCKRVLPGGNVRSEGIAIAADGESQTCGVLGSEVPINAEPDTPAKLIGAGHRKLIAAGEPEILE